MTWLLLKRLPVCFLTGVILSCKDQHQHISKNENAAQTGNAAHSDWPLTSFHKADSVNPVLGPGSGEFFCPIRKAIVKWEEKDVFNPAVIVKGATIFMLYRAEDKVGRYAGTSRIGLAESRDGLHFTRHSEPVFFPAEDEQKKYEWEGGCEDPRIVEDGKGTYFMTYTAFDGRTARLLVASSKDLTLWKKHGPAFLKAYRGKYLDSWSKSGSIISKYENGRIIAVKINGKYWMYWGDINICAAVSDDLIEWVPLIYQKGEKPMVTARKNPPGIADVKIIFGPRNGYFDSDLVEPGPPAMLTGKGIRLIYNGRNARSTGDTTLLEGTYAASQILLDPNDPSKVLERMNTCFLKPDKPYEINGQVNQVCFVEGLVNFNNKWFLYYGTGDSQIAVASMK